MSGEEKEGQRWEAEPFLAPDGVWYCCLPEEHRFGPTAVLLSQTNGLFIETDLILSDGRTHFDAPINFVVKQTMIRSLGRQELLKDALAAKSIFAFGDIALPEFVREIDKKKVEELMKVLGGYFCWGEVA